MEQRDYLQNQIEKLGRVLGKIFTDLLGLKSTGKINNGFEVASQFLKAELDFEITGLIDMPIDSFLEQLKSDKRLNTENLVKLTNIFLLLADNSNDDKRKNILYEKSLAILNFIEEQEQTYSIERRFTIEKIKNNLNTDKQSYYSGQVL
jgi:hypothetical protein